MYANVIIVPVKIHAVLKGAFALKAAVTSSVCSFFSQYRKRATIGVEQRWCQYYFRQVAIAPLLLKYWVLNLGSRKEKD